MQIDNDGCNDYPLVHKHWVVVQLQYAFGINIFCEHAIRTCPLNLGDFLPLRVDQCHESKGHVEKQITHNHTDYTGNDGAVVIEGYELGIDDDLEHHIEVHCGKCSQGTVKEKGG